MNNNNITIENIDTSNPDELQRFQVFFERHLIHVTLTSNPFIVRRWIRVTLWFKHKQYCRRGLIVGLGIQRPPYLNSDATLQLSVGHHCLVFHIQHARTIPPSFWRFLYEHKNTFFDVFDHNEPSNLLDFEHQLLVWNLIDVRDEVKLLGWTLSGAVGRSSFGFQEMHMLPEIGNSTWDDVTLTEEQVQYATINAFLYFFMGMALNARHRRHWAKR